MSNAILARPDLSDAATITGPSGAGDLTIGNLQKRSLVSAYRTTTLSGNINIDLGSAKNINFIALVAHNATASGTVTVKAGSTDAVSDYTSGSLSLITGADIGNTRNIFSFQIDPAESHRYWRLEYSDAGNTDGYFQAGRLYLSSAFQPDTNVSFGLQQGFIDDSRVSRTRSGEAVPVIRSPYRVFGLDFNFLNEDEAFNQLFRFDHLRGKSKDVLFIKDPAALNHFQRGYVYGLINELEPISHAAHNIFRKRYEIREIPSGS